MSDNNSGYYEYPENSDGIKRAKTTKLLRLWQIPRAEKVLEILKSDFSNTEFPGLYILFDSKKKLVYIGEAKNLYNRLRTHLSRPEEKIKNWGKALVINDGRPATQSVLNDNAIRKALEYFLIILFKTNKYNVVSQGEIQKLNSEQKYSFNSLKEELIMVLLKMNFIQEMVEDEGQEKVFKDDLEKIIIRNGKKINEWSTYEAIIDDEKVFIREGSKKPRGWQITFRGRKPGSFIDSLQKGNGHLLIPRNGVLLIPLTEVQKVIKDKSAYDQDTIDIWIVFSEEKATLSYKKRTIDVTKFKLID